jgi:exonuclease SbcC
MIESLTLTHFQCHEFRKFNLGKVTILVGDNDAGKSAVLRALRWAALNEWEGEADQFITWGKNSAAVSIVIDGHQIDRMKGGPTNTYFLDGVEFPNFGRQVPQAIAKYVNLSPANFQEQQDPAYWLMLSSPDAAAALNEIFSLTAIDTTMSNMASELRQARSKVSICEERLEAAKKARAELDWTVEANAQLKEIETLFGEITANGEEQESLQATLDKIESSQAEEQKLEEVQARTSEKIARLIEVIRVGEEAEELNRQVFLLATYENMEDTVCRLSKSLNEKQALLSKWMKEACPLCGK